ncbi:hypothetical protein Hanom_Chr07g00631121 [Helianthus anomalus]
MGSGLHPTKESPSSSSLFIDTHISIFTNDQDHHTICATRAHFENYYLCLIADGSHQHQQSYNLELLQAVRLEFYTTHEN